MFVILKPHFDFQVHLLFKLSSFFLSLPPCRSPLISDHFRNKGAEFVSLFWQIHCRVRSFFISTNTLPLGQNYALYIPSCKMSAVKSSCDCFFCNDSQKKTLSSLLFASPLNNPHKYFDQIQVWPFVVACKKNLPNKILVVHLWVEMWIKGRQLQRDFNSYITRCILRVWIVV